MKQFRLFFYLFFAATLSLLPAGCESSDEPVDQPRQVELKADGTAVQVGDPVKMTVLCGGEDVTSQARIIDMQTGEAVANPFVSSVSDAFLLAAEYDGKVSAPVAVSVLGGTFEPAGDFYRGMLIHQLTGTWCQYCPAMTTSLEKVIEDMPGRVTVIAIHSGDLFATTAGKWLYNYFKPRALPDGRLNYREVLTTTVSPIKQAINETITNDPATCGVAVKSWVKDGRVCVTAKLRFTEEGDYTVCCALTEDKLYYKAGDSYSPDYYYHWVLRDMAPSHSGIELGTCKAGVEYPCAFTVNLNASWVPENCRTVVYVMKKSGEGTFYTNNVAACPVEGSCDFKYDDK